MKKFTIFFLLFLNIFFVFSSNSYKLIRGSNIYNKIFIFFFQLSNRYNTYIVENNDQTIDINININKSNIISEPINDINSNLYETDLNFSLKNLNIKETSNQKITVVLRCNHKITIKTENFFVITRENIVVIKGNINYLLEEVISDEKLTVSRKKWKFPLYFDLRIQKN